MHKSKCTLRLKGGVSRTEIVVRNSDTMALRNRRSATAMRMSPFTEGLKGEGPSADQECISAFQATAQHSALSAL